MTVLETRNLTKEFPGVRALSDFSFTLEKGEIHGLVGENGAGKSTLVKILAGVHTPSSGSFLLNGREMHFRSPRDAADRIGVVHQERELVPHFSGWENLFLGLEFSSAGFLLKKKMREDALRFAEKYGMDVDLDAPASEMGSGRQEMLSILKVLFRNPEVVIFDEPTAPLSVKECESLFALVRDLKARGLAILYISHHLSEVLDLADRVTVLRNGKRVDTLDASSVDEQGLIRLMIDRDLAGQYPKRPVALGKRSLPWKDALRRRAGSRTCPFPSAGGRSSASPGLWARAGRNLPGRSSAGSPSRKGPCASPGNPSPREVRGRASRKAWP